MNESKSTMKYNEEEWHQKYAFIITLLQKPHAILVKGTLAREKEKLVEKLSAYRLERNLFRENINAHLKE
jgi:hypothetical protein